jgi:hypothetical protein
LGVVEHIGALSQLNYKNALNFINEDILKASTQSEEQPNVTERLSRLGQRLYNLSQYGS